MMWGYGWGWPAMLWMGFGGILWLVVLGLLVWALVRWLGGRSGTSSYPPVQPMQPAQPMQGPSAMEILRQRYARGEIDATTYEQMRERLEASAQPPASSDGPGVMQS